MPIKENDPARVLKSHEALHGQNGDKDLSSDSDFHNLLNTLELFDALPFYVLLVDEQHYILHANVAVRQHLGVEPKDIIGGYCPEVIHGTDGTFHGCPLEESVEKMQAIEREVYDSETSRWIQSCIYPTGIKTDKGLQVFLHMVTDITEKKHAEEQLKDSRDKLRRLSAHLESLGEEERKKIARDLHDDTAQLLASMAAQLQAASRMLPDSQKRIKNILKNVEMLSVNVIEHLQKLTYQLRPLVLDDLGLVSAVDWLIDINLKAAGIKTVFRKNGQIRRLDHQIETTVFRVIQEAVSNIIRHSKADSVTITLNFTATAIQVTVKDNGNGFNLEEALNANDGLRGLGLLGMRERIVLLNGTFDIETNPAGGGTEICFSLPLQLETPGNDAVSAMEFSS